MNFLVLIIGIIFISCLILIMTEKLDKTVVAMLGGGIALLLAIIPGSGSNGEAIISDVHDLFALLPLDLLLIIIGMTLMIGLTRQTGFFEYIALILLKRYGNNQIKLFIAFSLMTLIASAFLDAYLAVVIISTITIAASDSLDINPKPYLISEAFFSNVGEIMSRIASQPNLIYGDYFNLNFLIFFAWTAPYVALTTVVTIYLLVRIFRKELSKPISNVLYYEIKLIDNNSVISDPRGFKISVIVLILTICGFIIVPFIIPYMKLELGYLALAGGFTMVALVGKKEAESALKNVEWQMVFFLVGLLVLLGIGGKVGLIETVTAPFMVIFGSSLPTFVSLLILLWTNCLVSSVVDNVPLAAIMSVLIDNVRTVSTIPFYPILVAAVIGTNLGDNFTPIGSASTNQALMALNHSEKEEAHVSLFQFFKLGCFVGGTQLVIGSGYIILLLIINWLFGLGTNV